MSGNIVRKVYGNLHIFRMNEPATSCKRFQKGASNDVGQQVEHTTATPLPRLSWVSSGPLFWLLRRGSNLEEGEDSPGFRRRLFAHAVLKATFRNSAGASRCSRRSAITLRAKACTRETGLITARTIGHHAGQGRHFSQPTSVVLALDFDREHHVRSCHIWAFLPTDRSCLR